MQCRRHRNFGGNIEVKSMKKIKLTCMFLIVSIMLCSCGGKTVGKGESIMEYGNTAISEGAYKYLFASVKQYYIDSFSDIEDTSDYWQETSPNGKTYAEVIDGEVRKAVLAIVISAQLYDDSGYKLSDDDTQTITDTLDSVIEDFGGRSALNIALSDYELDDKSLEDIYKLQYKYEYMISESPLSKVDESYVEKYYNENYNNVKFIFFDTENDYVFDENGKKVVGSDGNYKSVKLNDEQKQEKIKKAEETYDKFLSGADFDSEYASQKEFDSSFYPNGMYFCKDNYQALGISTVAIAAFDMKPGEIKLITDDNASYIVKKCELPERAYENDTDSVQFTDLVKMCEAYRFQDAIDALTGDVIKNDDIINKYSVSNTSAVKF